MADKIGPTITRRSLLQSGGVGALGMATSRFAFGQDSSLSRSEALLDGLDLGVASGDPGQDSVVLWTRVPQAGRDLPGEDVSVVVELASQRDFYASSLVLQVEVLARFVDGYCLNFLAEGLQAGTTYYYRFYNDRFTSQRGRTRTLPQDAQQAAQLKFAVCSCQNFTAGLYNVYDAMLKDDVDFAVHLGDFIYEDGGANIRVDYINQGMPVHTLEHYRQKYALYLSDRSLQRVRAWFPWFYMWDDHEVDDNYSGVEFGLLRKAQKAAAYQAYQEFIPMRSRLERWPNEQVHLQMFRAVSIPGLAEFVMTDLRQYRSPNICVSTHGAKVCDAHSGPERTTLGTYQKKWLKRTLAESTNPWKFVFNEVMFMPVQIWKMPGIFAREAGLLADRFMNLDAWDGFPAEREELLEFYWQEKIKNIVYFTGDIHNFFAGRCHLDTKDVRSPLVAREIVTASISSAGLKEIAGKDLNFMVEPYLKLMNKHMDFADLRMHGYLSVAINPEVLVCDFMAVDTITSSSYSVSQLHRTRVLSEF